MALPVLMAGAASATTAPPWTIQPTPSPGTFNNLLGVSCPSATRCVAAGFESPVRNSVFTTLTETWNGTIWQVATLVNGDPLASAASSSLKAVSCPVTTKCEMVGDFTDTSGNPKPLAAVWNGVLGKASVASQPVPLPPGANAGHLNGVSCTSVNACIAVGVFATATGAGGALAERWNGSRWQLIQSGLAVGGSSADFNAVSCTSATFCMAVGQHAAETAELVAIWNGSTWQVVLGSNFNGVPFADLSGVSCTADGACMMVGTQSNPVVPAGSDNLALRWIRGQFFLLTTGNLSSIFNVLNAVSCTSASGCLAVGHFQDFRGQQDTTAEHWDGTSWSFEATPNPAGTVPDLNGVSCSSPATCTAVGIFKNFSGKFQTLAERFVAAGPHGFSLTRNGTVLALLRKPRTLELLVFQRGRHGHLLGPVALGNHPRGLSRIGWNLRVGGRKLAAGSYTAELVAVLGRGVTSDGPSVTFDLTRAGAVRVLSATCSVTAAERGRC